MTDKEMFQSGKRAIHEIEHLSVHAASVPALESELAAAKERIAELERELASQKKYTLDQCARLYRNCRSAINRAESAESQVAELREYIQGLLPRKGGSVLSPIAHVCADRSHCLACEADELLSRTSTAAAKHDARVKAHESWIAESTAESNKKFIDYLLRLKKSDALKPDTKNTGE